MDGLEHIGLQSRRRMPWCNWEVMFWEHGKVVWLKM